MTEQPQIRADFVIQQRGRSFVLYAGLVDLAHRQGLVALVTEALTVTATLAVFKATATFADGRVFTGHGDATPENVGKTIAPHFLRMAETRAKARALRDALNVAAAALEELGDPEEGAGAPVAPAEPTPIRREARLGGSSGPVASARPPGPAWGSTPLGRQVTALAAALTTAGKAFGLPADDADEAALKRWLATQQTALGAR